MARGSERWPTNSNSCLSRYTSTGNNRKNGHNNRHTTKNNNHASNRKIASVITRIPIMVVQSCFQLKDLER